VIAEGFAEPGLRRLFQVAAGPAEAIARIETALSPA
jgi:hypothetical protein